MSWGEDGAIGGGEGGLERDARVGARTQVRSPQRLPNQSLAFSGMRVE